MVTIPMAAHLEDSTLIQRALAGDTESFAALVSRHICSIRRCVACIVRNPSDAEDVVQDVLLKVWRRLSTFRSECTFRTWATRVASNQALMLYRRDGKRRLQPIQDPDQLISPDEWTDEIAMRREEEREVHRALCRLPQMYRTVLMLHDLQELSLKETAQQLAVTLPAVKSRLFRGRLMLSAAMQNSGARLARAA